MYILNVTKNDVLLSEDKVKDLGKAEFMAQQYSQACNDIDYLVVLYDAETGEIVMTNLD